MNGWQRTPDSVYWTRPLGTIEFIFTLDGLHQGVAECGNPITCTKAGLSKESIKRAWARTTRVHPLVAATLSIAEDRQSAVYLLKESDLEGRDDDVVFVERQEQLPSQLSDWSELLPMDRHLARLVALPLEHGKEVIFYFLTNHSIGDGMSQFAIMRTFFDQLDAGSTEELPDIETQLKRVPAPESLFRHQRMSPALQRWRRATAKIVLQNRMARWVGGKTLPRLRIAMPSDKPVSAWLSRKFSASDSKRMLAYVTSTKMAYHHHFCACVQIAMMRTLYRLQADGRLFDNDAEWQQCLREPILHGGPLNMRPLIGYEAFTVCCCMGVYFVTFPSLAAKKNSSSSVPTYDELCSKQRFLHRTRLSQERMVEGITHPLFEELWMATLDGFMRSRPAWGGPPPTTKPLRDLPGRTMAFGGGSLGRLDKLLPAHYSNGLELRQDDKFIHLHTRPGELYCGSLFWKDELYVFGAVDVATYDRDVVELFFDEIAACMKHYLLSD